jgi:hypothetical protein
MKRALLRRLMHADFDRLLAMLTTSQHVRPHDPVAAALAKTVSDLGVCPNAVERSLEWLGLNGDQSIGRLRRTELMQLARTVHRFWRQRGTPEMPQRQPH